jgi:hypothetical protein
VVAMTSPHGLVMVEWPQAVYGLSGERAGETAQINI